jgi:hypothetical protein
MFTENQVRQFYVVNSVVTGNNDVTNASTAGATKLKVHNDEFYFLHKGASDDGLQRSDIVKKTNIMDIRATAAADMVHKLKKLEVTLDSAVNSGAPLVGQDYILTLIIKNYIANGDDSEKIKFGATKAKNTVASDLYKDLAMSIAKNFARESVKLIKVTLKGDSNNTEITSKTKASDLSAITATGIYLEEVEQPWRRGVAKVEYVNFEAIPSTIYVDGSDQKWGDIKDVTSANTNVLQNSKRVADMEWFFHKERGDVYGDAGYPNNIETTYMVNPNNTDGYSFIDIHFYFEGNSQSVGRSEKTLTLVGSLANLKSIIGTAASGDDPATGLIAALEGTGVTIKKSANWDTI